MALWVIQYPDPSSPSRCPQPPQRASFPSGLTSSPLEPVPAMSTTPPLSDAAARVPTVSLTVETDALREGNSRCRLSLSSRFVSSRSQPLRLRPKAAK